MLYVKPAPGLVIRDPDLRDLLPPEGRSVSPSPYWARRLRDKDVVLATPPAPAPAVSLPTSAPKASA